MQKWEYLEVDTARTGKLVIARPDSVQALSDFIARRLPWVKVKVKAGYIELQGDKRNLYAVELLNVFGSVGWELAGTSWGKPGKGGAEQLTLILKRPILSEEIERQECPGCGAKIRAGGNFCPSCGAALREVVGELPAQAGDQV